MSQSQRAPALVSCGVSRSCSFMLIFINLLSTIINSSNGLKLTPKAHSVVLNRAKSAHQRNPTIKLTPSIQKNLKLPVWPVFGGVLIQVADWIGAKSFAEYLWSTIGGRVVPISLSSMKVSPFLLLAHHVHSFSRLDPLRPISKFFLPEGFPAHPHAGFDTVTYCLEGGLRHRDSEGCSMSYGDGEIQWMRAGRGIIHEEMWNLFSRNNSDHKRIEIFQLWVNLKSEFKADPAAVKVIKDSDIPVIHCGSQGETCKVLCGRISYGGDSIFREDIPQSIPNAIPEESSASSSSTTYFGPGNEIAKSPITILHVSLPKESCTLKLEVPFDSSVVVYIRRGSLQVENVPTDGEVFCGDMVIYQSTDTQQEDSKGRIGISGSFEIKSGNRGLDCLVLIGEPLREPVVMGGPFVASSEEEYYGQARAFENIGRNAFWDHKISNVDWQRHCNELNLKERLNPLE